MSVDPESPETKQESMMVFLAHTVPVFFDNLLRGTKLDASVHHFEHFWQFYDLVQLLLSAD